MALVVAETLKACGAIIQRNFMADFTCCGAVVLGTEKCSEIMNKDSFISTDNSRREFLRTGATVMVGAAVLGLNTEALGRPKS